MKFSASLAMLVIVGLVASSSALPARKRIVYVHRPAQYRAAPQRLMYVQHNHPSPCARSTQGAEALVSGESVATGTFLKDCNYAEAEISASGPAVTLDSATVDINAERGVDVLSGADANGVQSVAGADIDIVAEENEVSGADSAENPEVPVADSDADVGVNGDVPADTDVAADLPVAKPVNRYLPAESSEDSGLSTSVEDEQEEGNRRAVSKKPGKNGNAPAKRVGGQKPLPPGTFFPASFGGTRGGAIAIANSFSTGEGGAATSHAVAYGTPDAAAHRGCANCKKH